MLYTLLFTWPDYLAPVQYGEDVYLCHEEGEDLDEAVRKVREEMIGNVDGVDSMTEAEDFRLIFACYGFQEDLS